MNCEESISTSIHLSRDDSSGTHFSLNVDLKLAGQGITAIFGHSGSGKTTLLRCIAGLEQAEGASICINGQIWQDETHFVPTHKRALGYVFQEASLFSHLTALGNLQYALKRAWEPVSQEFLDKVVSVLDIKPLLQRYPSQLSGGERQRVAIARAILIRPKVLLMDEPLASLDSNRKAEILPYLSKLPAVFNIPILYVSHSLEEVCQLADQCVLLDKGQVVAEGTPQEVFSRIDLPVRFDQGTGVIIKGTVVERDPKWHLSRVEFSGNELWVRDGGDEIGDDVRIRILARDVSLTEQPCDQSSILNRIHVEVVEIEPDQDEAMSLIRLKAGTEYLIARVTNRSVSHLQLEKSKKIWAQIKSVAIVY
ncbi:molybdenum ABC transporter ATP-binding protein [Neptuniibacter sp.]|uniref:molybdenum ABC transporter ATP-binding protein n=1 Tax=Neptuniibacter sp. TaxID=1962643 RepID=UPI003B5B4536